MHALGRIHTYTRHSSITPVQQCTVDYLLLVKWWWYHPRAWGIPWDAWTGCFHLSSLDNNAITCFELPTLTPPNDLQFQVIIVSFHLLTPTLTPAPTTLTYIHSHTSHAYIILYLSTNSTLIYKLLLYKYMFIIT